VEMSLPFGMISQVYFLLSWRTDYPDQWNLWV